MSLVKERLRLAFTARRFNSTKSGVVMTLTVDTESPISASDSVPSGVTGDRTSQCR